VAISVALIALLGVVGIREVIERSQVQLAVAGDVCDTDPETCRPVADLVRNLKPTAWVPAGDLQYKAASLARIRAGYDFAFRHLRPITQPVIGNHEIKEDKSAADYCAYFGAAARCPSHAYRVDYGRWSLIALDSNQGASPEKVTHFRQLLAEAGDDHVAVVFHHPLWSSPCDGCHGNVTKVAGFWDVAVPAGVDVMVGAHDHKYERFDRMTTTGPDANGIPQFVSGMGGAHPDPGCGSTLPGSVFCVGNMDAVLVLTLHKEGFTYDLRRADGSDKGRTLDTGYYATREAWGDD
jgi:hypothetical protein